MRVILNADIEKLGRKGDLVEVTPGYARNYLLPKKLALTASKGAIRQAETMRRARQERESRERDAAEGLATRIEALKLTVAARAGEEGQLFGSVTTSHIAEELQRALGEEIDRRRVHLPEPVRSLGVHEFTVQVRPDVAARGSIEVIPET
ncbi:MAG: 50S ribosomal protein L9 [Actinomycetota bacterium]